jgi:hypothetical protein
MPPSQETWTLQPCSRPHSPCCCRSPTVQGSFELRDGSASKLDPEALIAAEEAGLRLLAAASVVLAAALVAFRI